MQHQNRRDADAELIRKASGNLIRGFFGYLVLTPMIFSWGVLLLILLAITLVSFQQQTIGVITVMMEIFGKILDFIPFLDSYAKAFLPTDETGAIRITGDNLDDVIFGVYGLIAVPFVIVGTLLEFFRGGRPPRPLSRKMKILAVLTGLTIAVFFASFLFGSETFNGGPLGWVLMFTLGPGVVFGVSAVSLFLHHIITSSAIGDSP
jgi:hypothetical protein